MFELFCRSHILTVFGITRLLNVNHSSDYVLIPHYLNLHFLSDILLSMFSYAYISSVSLHLSNIVTNLNLVVSLNIV